MDTLLNLSTGEALIAGIPRVRTSFQTVEGFGKLQRDPLLPNALIANKEVAVNDLIRSDRSLKQFDGH
jgi:hypothetical protein